jgi:tRNA(fMet)-specific endonuclease VapC
MLDSTACIDYLNGNTSIKERLSEFRQYLCLSTISIYEINIGLERTKRKKNRARFNELNQKWLEFLHNLVIFSVTPRDAKNAAKIFDQLESKGERIEDNDCLIAGVMHTNAISQILTRNSEHFNRIDGIKIIDYAL